MTLVWSKARNAGGERKELGYYFEHTPIRMRVPGIADRVLFLAFVPLASFEVAETACVESF